MRYREIWFNKASRWTGYTILGTGVGVAGVVGVGGLTVAGTVLGTGIGAGMGEILDHVPYFNHAIPDGVGYIANYFNPETAQRGRELLYGNLDKLGAALGFIGGFLKTSTSTSVKHAKDD